MTCRVSKSSLVAHYRQVSFRARHLSFAELGQLVRCGLRGAAHLLDLAELDRRVASLVLAGFVRSRLAHGCKSRLVGSHLAGL